MLKAVGSVVRRLWLWLQSSPRGHSVPQLSQHWDQLRTRTEHHPSPWFTCCPPNKWTLAAKWGAQRKADTKFIIITMIHGRGKSISLNRVEWLIKGYESWLDSCTDLIRLRGKLAVASSYTILLSPGLGFVIKLLSYGCCREIRLWSEWDWEIGCWKGFRSVDRKRCEHSQYLHCRAAGL